MNNYNVHERQGLFIEIEEAGIFVYVSLKIKGKEIKQYQLLFVDSSTMLEIGTLMMVQTYIYIYMYFQSIQGKEGMVSV